MKIEEKLEAMGLELPSPLQPPPGIEVPFAWVRVRRNRAYLAGSREVGPHAQSSIGMALPLNAPVVCEAEVGIDS